MGKQGLWLNLKDPRGLEMIQHNRPVAQMLGCAPAEIDAMVADGVLYAEEAVSRRRTKASSTSSAFRAKRTSTS
jgi:hypothetical protein